MENITEDIKKEQEVNFAVDLIKAQEYLVDEFEEINENLLDLYEED